MSTRLSQRPISGIEYIFRLCISIFNALSFPQPILGFDYDYEYEKNRSGFIVHLDFRPSFSQNPRMFDLLTTPKPHQALKGRKAISYP